METSRNTREDYWDGSEDRSILSDDLEQDYVQCRFSDLSEGNGAMLAGWLRLEAGRRGLKDKNIYKALRLGKSQYRKLLSGGACARALPAVVFARVAAWLHIPIIAALAAAGISGIDNRRAELNRGKIIDLGLDRLSCDPLWGKHLPAEAYLAQESIREELVRLYQEVLGVRLIPESDDWHLILRHLKESNM